MLRLLLIFTICILAKCQLKEKRYFAKVAKRRPLCEVEDRFISVALGASKAENGFRIIQFDSQKLKNLISALRPAYFRLGGSAANFLIFQPESSNLSYPINNPHSDNFNLTAANFDKFASFVNETGLDLVFDLNAFPRLSNGSWDASNARELLNHVAKRHYNVGWQLGNEPNSYRKYGMDRVITGLQMGKDFKKLRRILEENPDFGSLLIGPDVTRPGRGGSSEKFLNEFLPEAKQVINAVAWHQYYVDGRQATLQDFTNPSILALLETQLQIITGILSTTNTNKPMWLSESGSAFGGGARGLSETYVAAFMFLDKLGLSGVYCNTVVMRQSVLSGPYALLEKGSYFPRPDYWLALLHKKLAGKKVLKVSGNDSHVRFYVHCTKVSPKYTAGAVTFIAMNLYNDTDAKISLKRPLRDKVVHEYLMTPLNGNLTSSMVQLNGVTLQLNQDDTIPVLHHRQIKQPFILPPLSYGFYVLPDAGNSKCM